VKGHRELDLWGETYNFMNANIPYQVPTLIPNITQDKAVLSYPFCIGNEDEPKRDVK
jgi:hypothetical protein